MKKITIIIIFLLVLIGCVDVEENYSEHVTYNEAQEMIKESLETLFKYNETEYSSEFSKWVIEEKYSEELGLFYIVNPLYEPEVRLIYSYDKFNTEIEKGREVYHGESPVKLVYFNYQEEVVFGGDLDLEIAAFIGGGIKTYKQEAHYEDQVLPFETTEIGIETMLIGTSELVTAGVNGLERVYYGVVYIDGKLSEENTITNRETLIEPITEVYNIGIKLPTEEEEEEVEETPIDEEENEEDNE